MEKLASKRFNVLSFMYNTQIFFILFLVILFACILMFILLMNFFDFITAIKNLNIKSEANIFNARKLKESLKLKDCNKI